MMCPIVIGSFYTSCQSGICYPGSEHWQFRKYCLSPSSGRVTVQMDEFDSDSKFVVFDPNGKVFYQGSLSPGDNLFDLSEQLRGVYTLREESDSCNGVLPLIVQ